MILPLYPRSRPISAHFLPLQTFSNPPRDSTAFLSLYRSSGFLSTYGSRCRLPPCCLWYLESPSRYVRLALVPTSLLVQANPLAKRTFRRILTSFNRIEFLFPGPKMKFLCSCKCLLFQGEPQNNAWKVLMACIYLSVDSEIRIPRIWRNNLANAISTSLGPNFLHVLERISPFLLCWAICWRFLNAMRATFLLKRFANRRGLVAPFDRGQV